jgi:hypothetical protein
MAQFAQKIHAAMFSNCSRNLGKNQRTISLAFLPRGPGVTFLFPSIDRRVKALMRCVFGRMQRIKIKKSKKPHGRREGRQPSRTCSVVVAVTVC